MARFPRNRGIAGRLAIAASVASVVMVISAAGNAEAPLVVDKSKVFVWIGSSISLPTRTFYNDVGTPLRDPNGREVSLTLYELGIMFGVSDGIDLLFWLPMHEYKLSTPSADPSVMTTRSYFQLEMACVSVRYKLPIKVFENVLELKIGVPFGSGSNRYYEQEAFTISAKYLARIEFVKVMFAQGYIGIDLISKYSTHNVGWNAELGYMPTRYFNFGLGFGGVYPLGGLDNQNPFDKLPSGQGSIYLQPFIYTDPVGGLEVRFAFNFMLLGWNQFYMNMFDIMVSYRF